MIFCHVGALILFFMFLSLPVSVLSALCQRVFALLFDPLTGSAGCVSRGSVTSVVAADRTRLSLQVCLLLSSSLS